MDKFKRIIKALLPFLFAISLASFSITILEKVGVPSGIWFFAIFLAVAAWVINNKNNIFKE